VAAPVPRRLFAMDAKKPALACLFAAPLTSWACSPCRAYVKAAIFDGGFALRLLVMLLPVLAVGAIAFAVWAWGRSSPA